MVNLHQSGSHCAFECCSNKSNGGSSSLLGARQVEWLCLGKNSPVAGQEEESYGQIEVAQAQA